MKKATDERLVIEVAGNIKRAIQIKAASDNVSIREKVEPILKRAFKKEIKELDDVQKETT